MTEGSGEQPRRRREDADATGATETRAAEVLTPEILAPATWTRYRVLALLTAAAAIAYVTRNAVGVAESTIRDELDLTLRQSGFFMGAFFWSYALLQVPGGWLAHRFGTRASMFLFAATWSASACLIGVAEGLWLLVAGQLLMGGAQAGIFPASCHSISHWISLGRRTLACGWLALGMQVGAITAGLLTGPLILLIGWRSVFFVYAVPGFVCAAVFLIRFCNHPAVDPRVNEAEGKLIAAGRAVRPPTTETSSRTPWIAIFQSPAMWFLCGQQVCRASGYMFFASWFPTFLQQTRDVSVADSGYLQACVFSGTMTGCLCGGWLTDWIWGRTGDLRLSRSGVGATFLLICGLLILTSWFIDSTLVAVLLLSGGAFFAALAGPCAFAATIDLGGDHVPQVFGLMNMTGNLAAAACPILVAELFEWTSNWGMILLVFASIYLAGAVCWALVDSRRAIQP